MQLVGRLIAILIIRDVDCFNNGFVLNDKTDRERFILASISCLEYLPIEKRYLIEMELEIGRYKKEMNMILALIFCASGFYFGWQNAIVGYIALTIVLCLIDG